MNSGEMDMDQKGMDKGENEAKEPEDISGHLAELEASKAREARRWQRKRATIKRFAGMK